MSIEISADIYELTQFTNEIKQKFVDVDQETLFMHTFGYLGSMFSQSMQNAVIMAAEYSNESIPVKAKFDKNVITHALSLGINKINATPAYMTVTIAMPEKAILANMKNDKFTFDKDVKIFIDDDFEFHIDYDIILSRSKLSTGEFAYTALYNMDIKNLVSDITNPNLPPVAIIKTDVDNMIILTCKIRQVEYTQKYKKVLTTNTIENKTLNFSFDSQLAAFDIDVVEGGNAYHLVPVYDGLYTYETGLYCYYSYLDKNNIRIKFNRDVYEPRINADVTINIKQTSGAAGNFKYNSQIKQTLESERFNYEDLYCIITPITDSVYGMDKKSIDDIKKLIPKEALSRGSITNNTDLQNFFNSIDTESCRLYFRKKRYNQIEYLYFSYLLIKDNNNIVPTNSIDMYLTSQDMLVTDAGTYILKPGSIIYYDGKKGKIVKEPTAEQLEQMYTDGFVYINPFLLVMNKSPLYYSYFLTVMDLTKYLEFTYINQRSVIQFISSAIKWKREFLTDPNTYKLSIELLQNISVDSGLIELDQDGNVINCNIKVGILLFSDDDKKKPYRYSIASLKSYDESQYIYKFEFQFETEDIISDESKMKINNTYDLKTTNIAPGYFKDTTQARIYIFAKFTDVAGIDDAANYFPELDGYTLCNKYDITSGIDFFYNYSEIMQSVVSTAPLENSTEMSYDIKRMPVVGKKYINSEDRMQSFIDEVEMRRQYIIYCLQVLEDPFGIDLKFFNTYGPANIFYVDDEVRINKVNLSMTFKLKTVTNTDKKIVDNITTDIKAYLEDINELSDLHIPNLITEITNNYREQIVYFEFVDINGYGPGFQHIYQDTVTENSLEVPEFLNVNTLDDDSPDINIILV
jgi:hypothetical protein